MTKHKNTCIPLILRLTQNNKDSLNVDSMKNDLPVRKPSDKEQLKSCPSTLIWRLPSFHDNNLRNQFLLILNKPQTNASVFSNKFIYNIYGSFLSLILKSSRWNCNNNAWIIIIHVFAVVLIF